MLQQCTTEKKGYTIYIVRLKLTVLKWKQILLVGAMYNDTPCRMQVCIISGILPDPFLFFTHPPPPPINGVAVNCMLE